MTINSNEKLKQAVPNLGVVFDGINKMDGIFHWILVVTEILPNNVPKQPIVNE